MDLTELKSAIRQCNYSFEERDTFDVQKILDNLGQFIVDTASGYCVERDYYFTKEDIIAYKKHYRN